MKPPFWALCVGTGFGAGFSPVAPGTAGALLAVAIWTTLRFFISPSAFCGITALLIVCFTIVGALAADRLEKHWGEDPSRVVVDEMVGVWIPLLVVPHTSQWWMYAIAAFVLFRLFDITKPLGIRRMESLKGGMGIMMDDILAGVYSLILIAGFKWIIG